MRSGVVTLLTKFRNRILKEHHRKEKVLLYLVKKHYSRHNDIDMTNRSLSITET